MYKLNGDLVTVDVSSVSYGGGELSLQEYINLLILENDKKKYYVGCLLFDTKNINPKTYLGFGTWSLWRKWKSSCRS